MTLESLSMSKSQACRIKNFLSVNLAAMMKVRWILSWYGGALEGLSQE
jgi:hypothetical protein